MTFWASLLEAGIRLTVPILLAALGELIAERSGVINVGLEGKMAAGAYTGFAVMSTTGDPWLAALGGVSAGALVGLVMAGVAVWGRVNQILTGFGLFIMVPGLTAFLYQQRVTTLVVTPALERLAVPGLSEIPLFGRALFAQNGFYFATAVLCAAVWVLLRKTRFGLSATACGHAPEAARSKGVSVRAVRTLATAACGGLAGLGGAALTVGALGSFSPGVIGGRGFVAIAVVILGRWNVGGTVLAAAAIGLSDALRLRLGGQVDFPVQLLAMIPWLVVLVMLISGARFAEMPRALGRNMEALH